VKAKRTDDRVGEPLALEELRDGLHDPCKIQASLRVALLTPAYKQNTEEIDAGLPFPPPAQMLK
jgi:hypothetical protein